MSRKRIFDDDDEEEEENEEETVEEEDLDEELHLPPELQSMR